MPKKIKHKSKYFAPHYRQKKLQATAYLYSVESAIRYSKGEVRISTNYYGSNSALTENQIINIAQSNYINDYNIKNVGQIVSQKVVGIYYGYGKKGY